MQGAGASSSGAWISDANFMDGGNNIEVDPLFIIPLDPDNAPSVGGNLRLQSVSHAVDTEFNPIVAGLTDDLDGETRFVEGDLDGSKTVDMGAYEKQNRVTYLPVVTL